MSSYYWLAYNDLSDAFWACHYGVTTHPLYGQCGICPSFSRCSSPLREANILRAALDEPIEIKVTISEEEPTCPRVSFENCKACDKLGKKSCPYN